MEEFTTRARELAGLVREFAMELTEAAGWSASLGEAKELTDALVAVRGATEAAYLRGLRIQDEREKAANPTGRGKNAAADALVFRYRYDPGVAQRDLRAARALDAVSGTLPAFAGALAAGEVTREHVDAATRTIERIKPSLRDRIVEITDQDNDEEEPVGNPRTVVQVAEEFLLAASLAKPARAVAADGLELLARVDPDTADGRDPGADARRSATWVKGPDGCLHLRVIFPPFDAPLAEHLLRSCARPTPQPADGEQQQDQQQGVLPIRDERPAAARAYDNLAALIFAGAQHAARASSSSPSWVSDADVSVHATAEQVAAAEQLAAGKPQTHAAGLATVDGVGPIPPAVLAYLLCGSRLTRVLTAPSGRVLDLGRAVRHASPAQRKALAARDRGCITPGCDQPAWVCIPHHVQEWQHHGPTNMRNLALLCRRHHREVHLGIWKVTIGDNGLPYMVAPRWLDPDRTPRRNTCHRISEKARKVGDQLRLALKLDASRPDAPNPPHRE